MIAILNQIKTHYGMNLHEQYAENSIPSIFAGVTNLSKLVEDHKWLAIQYSAHCANLMKELQKNSSPNAVATDLIYELESALLMAELLEHIYCHYMSDTDETDEIALMQRHQVEYRRMLRDRGRNLALNEKTGASSYSKAIHENIGAANRFRLLTIRVRRLFITTVPILTDFEAYCRFIRWAEESSGPLFSYLAWMTLLPRLLKNLTLLGMHLAPVEWWLDEKERSLSLGSRFNTQLERHWFELGNDLTTVSVGLFNCFVLTGAANLALGMSLLSFDVVLASWRAHYELKRLEEMKSEYEAMALIMPFDSSYMAFLNTRIEYEKLRHQVAITNTVLILFSTSLTLPILAFNIVIPLIGAALAVLTTIANMVAVQHIEQYKPADKVSYIPRLSLFSPPVNNGGDVIYPRLDNNGGDEMYPPFDMSRPPSPSHNRS